MNKHDVFFELGLLSLGSRLKRLSDQMMYQVSDIYRHRDIDFEPSWLPVFSLLQDGEARAVTDISYTLGLAHPSVIQITNAMIKKGVAVSQKDPSDSRRRLIQLTESGTSMLNNLTVVWDDIREAVGRIMEEANCNLLQDIEAVEKVMTHQNLFHRTEKQHQQRALASPKVEIVPYENAIHRQLFKDLNVAWVKRWFTMEAADYEVLDYPQENIIDPGGAILMAKLDGEVVGTCALIKVNSHLFELSKMAVAEKARGSGLGRQLGQAALEKAQKMGAKKVKLYSNDILKPALRLYQKLGFQHMPLDTEAEKYQRSNVKMEIDLTVKETI
ncbi:bifunctional helix-turn-helix transcriptional regulator/GNAT family N-acetyltransferase [Tunicatimonas pelagia]|uniref:bifunctional helix-turn-helix transcriptional regulator/GNAT family N-acetyltransferase n=1 Tax=Tunicatimonas pelagia TaxID=931531 RepID=UPI002665AE46|nr:bifunctional helix-turn-helix transcriptional regulator/GNAT family N-acetyltransferase [Tunicatimonas pelagia]WKN41272.1 bifunctional helix-turn-helix transcriptional regulator/GNAT family N-acetyltransferase [Tunicatimonas pelagia]